MTSKSRHNPGGDQIGEVIGAVQLPLENVEFALEQYLLDNGQRLDTETRVLLASIRDCVGRIAVSARHLSRGASDHGVQAGGQITVNAGANVGRAA
jgi:hypothetical protein